jgi:hypothetical protein
MPLLPHFNPVIPATLGASAPPLTPPTRNYRTPAASTGQAVGRPAGRASQSGQSRFWLSP